MDKMIKQAAIILSLLLIAASPNVVYVKSLKAKVMKEPSFKGAPIFTAETGKMVQYHHGR
jgi:hypothetical protein